MDPSLLVGEKITTDCKVYITGIEEGSAFLTVSVEVHRHSWLDFYMAGLCVSENARVPEFLPKLNSSSMAGSSGPDTSNFLIMALRANSIASVFIWLAGRQLFLHGLESFVGIHLKLYWSME